MLTDAVEGIVTGLVGDVERSAVLLNHGAAVLAGLVLQQGAFLVRQQVHVSAAGQIAIRNDDVGEEAHLAHVLRLEAVLLEDLHEVAGGAHLVRGVEHFVARSILGKQFLVRAEAAGREDGALGVDGVGLVIVVQNHNALAGAVFHHEIHALRTGANIDAQLVGSLLQTRLNDFAGVLVVFRHVVGAAVVVVQLNTHITQPSVEVVLLVRPNLDALSGFAVGALGLEELRQTRFADPLVVAGSLLRFGIDHIEEVHVELAVAAEDVQLLNEDDVLVRIGLLRADRSRQTRRAAADDHDVAALRRTLGRGLLRIGALDFRRIHASLLHRVSHSRLHRVGREGRRAHVVHIRGVRRKDAVADDRERAVNDHVGLMVVAQHNVGDDAVLDGDIHAHLAMVAVAGHGVGVGKRNAAGHHDGSSHQADCFQFVHLFSSCCQIRTAITEPHSYLPAGYYIQVHSQSQAQYPQFQVN